MCVRIMHVYNNRRAKIRTRNDVLITRCQRKSDITKTRLTLCDDDNDYTFSFIL